MKDAKEQSNFRLSQEIKATIKKLANHYGISDAAVVSIAIRRLFETEIKKNPQLKENDK
jgi:predicted DNA-binding protein